MMTRHALTCLAVVACSCAPKPVRAPDAPAADLIVLLPNPDDGKAGRAIASNAAGSVELNKIRASTTVVSNRAPSPVAVLSEAETQRLFGDVIASLPPVPTHFTLYFLFNSDELEPQSAAIVSRILETVANRPFPEVTVVGHTDTVGTAAANVELGLRRATAVRARLVRGGLDPTLVEATSHGESDPLIATRDNISEARNRRVEIVVR